MGAAVMESTRERLKEEADLAGLRITGWRSGSAAPHAIAFVEAQFGPLHSVQVTASGRVTAYVGRTPFNEACSSDALRRVAQEIDKTIAGRVAAEFEGRPAKPVCAVCKSSEGPLEKGAGGRWRCKRALACTERMRRRRKYGFRR